MEDICDTFDRDEDGLERLGLRGAGTKVDTLALANPSGFCSVRVSDGRRTFTSGELVEVGDSMDRPLCRWELSLADRLDRSRSDSVARLVREAFNGRGLSLPVVDGRARSDVISLDDLAAGRSMSSDEDAWLVWTGDSLRRLLPWSDKRLRRLEGSEFEPKGSRSCSRDIG